jgi:hypothetical protein
VRSSRAQFWAGLLAAALGLLSSGGCSADDGPVCQRDGSTDEYCFCRDGAEPCSLTCAEEANSCGVTCNGPRKNCSVSSGGPCFITCQAAVDCTSHCGDDSIVSCQDTAGTCLVVVGERAEVQCDRANDCQVTCNGSCEVNCALGHCRVSCSDPATCALHGNKGPDAELCPDGVTRVYGSDC